VILGLILGLIGLIAWAALVWDNRTHIKHDRWRDDD